MSLSDMNENQRKLIVELQAEVAQLRAKLRLIINVTGVSVRSRTLPVDPEDKRVFDEVGGWIIDLAGDPKTPNTSAAVALAEAEGGLIRDEPGFDLGGGDR